MPNYIVEIYNLFFDNYLLFVKRLVVIFNNYLLYLYVIGIFYLKKNILVYIFKFEFVLIINVL